MKIEVYCDGMYWYSCKWNYVLWGAQFGQLSAEAARREYSERYDSLFD